MLHTYTKSFHSTQCTRRNCTSNQRRHVLSDFWLRVGASLVNVFPLILILHLLMLIRVIWYQGPPPSGAFIRAMPVFRQPEHAKDVVRCCRNHTAEHTGKNKRDLTCEGRGRLTEWGRDFRMYLCKWKTIAEIQKIKCSCYNYMKITL